jgi:ubiquinone/menaquinone biosynthesis C-methylase UbiE
MDMQPRNSSNAWTNVDNAENKNEYIAYLNDLNSLRAITSYKQRTFDLLNIRESQCLLDVGCGIGQDAICLAGYVGQQGKVIALDISATMISKAKLNLPKDNLPIEFTVGDAESLNFSDNYFDGCRADRVFQHIGNIELALSEMIRVTKSEARIVISEPDWQTLIVDSRMRTETNIILSTITNMMRNPYIGRQLLGMFKRAGLEEISISTTTLILTDFSVASTVYQLEYGAKLAETSGALSTELSKKWLADQRSSSENHQFFASLTGFAVCGTKR